MYENQILILNELLSNENTVSGINLARKTNLSIKTIRKEIRLINDVLTDKQIKIISLPSEGYKIGFQNISQYRTFKIKIIDIYQRHLYFKDQQQNRVHYIIRRILTKTNKISLDDLAEECYVSKSLINRDMIIVKKKLSNYKLQIINQTKKGISIKGSEWHIRVCLVHEHRIYNNYISVFKNNEKEAFEKILTIDKDLDNKVKEILLETSITMKLQIPRNNFRKIIMMLVLSQTRKEYQNMLKFDQEEKDYLNDKNILEIVINLTNKLSLLGFQFTEEDITSIAIYILSVISIKPNNLKKYNQYSEIISQTTDILSYVNQVMPNIINYNKEVIENLACVLTGLLIRAKYNVLLDSEIVLGLESDGLLELDICILVIQYLKKNKYSVDIYEGLQLYFVFTLATYKIGVQQQKYTQILVFSRGGIFATKMMVKNLKDVIMNPYIEFKPVEYIELLMMDINDYDLLLTDFYDSKIKDLDIEKMNLQLFRSNDTQNSQLKKITKKLSENSIINLETYFSNPIVYQSIECSNKKQLFNYLKEEVLNKYEHCQEFIDECLEKEEYFPSIKKNQIAVLRSLHDFLGEDILKIIIPDKPIDWDGKICCLIILYNVKDNNYLKLKLINSAVAKILHQLPPMIGIKSIDKLKNNILEIINN